MTQKEKDLLLKDLCSRLPYGVICDCFHAYHIKASAIDVEDSTVYYFDCDEWEPIEYCKPYLFPLSSMTEEQKREYNYWKHEVPVCHYEYGDVVEEIELYDSPESFNYLIANHFDYNGLIPMGLAKDATGLNIYD